MARQRPSRLPCTSLEEHEAQKKDSPLCETPLAVSEVEVVQPPSCGNCSFWNRYMGSKLGFCRRFPPSVLNPTHLTSSGPVVIHGLTPAEELCGEHPRFLAK